MLIVVAIGVFLLAWIYILFIREFVLQRFPVAFQIEALLFKRSRTLLISWLYCIEGLLVGLQALAESAGLDVTPVITEVSNFIPQKYRGLAVALFLFLTGLAFSWLRSVTTKPLEGK